MKRMSVAMLAALMAVAMVGAAGCTKRKKSSKRSSSSTSDDRRAPTRTTARSSPGSTPSDPPGAACEDVLASMVSATGVAWKFNDQQSQATVDTTRKGGFRKCYFEVSSTRALPAAIMVITFYRINRNIDDDSNRVRALAAKNAGCTEQLASPPPGTTLAVQCLQKHGGTLFDVHTTISRPTGYVLAWVSMQPDAASATVQNRAREISRKAAVESLGLI